jgi:hypothetical protein
LDPFRTKRFFLAGVAIGVVAMSATGLAAARLIESPDQLAARSAAPAESIITGVARMRVLSDGIALPGIVRPGRTVNVTASAPYPTIVITGMPARLGSRVWPGHVIAQTDGRPVLLLRGKLPAFRSLREGDAGPDVGQLQAALGRLGYADYDLPGYFGPSTALALELLYEHLGYPVPMYRPHLRKPAEFPPLPTPYLPMDEVCYIPAASALVVSAPAKTGTKVLPGHLVLRLAIGHPYVTGRLSARQAAQVNGGVPARISSAGSATATALARVSVIPAYATGGSGQPRYKVVATSRRVLPERAIGSTVRLTLLVPVTAGPVLTVPLTAVFSGRRSAFVVLVSAAGHRQQVAVSTGPAAGGFVAVRATAPGALRPGDHVLIGVGR